MPLNLRYLNKAAYDNVTGFGEASALAMTWDKTFMYGPFKAIALKFYGKGFRVLNGPTSQPLERTLWGGRLVEAFTLDSYLNGKPFPRAFADAGMMPGGRKAFLAERAGDQPSSIGLLWCCAILQCRSLPWHCKNIPHIFCHSIMV
jgi:hypothetical protein